ncbi:MAG: DUF308 domain-containing protein [Clostridiales bacterium]|nr:DUF308 domain-containing protein [Clostridiales bacterium]
MKTHDFNYFGTSKNWWLLLIMGILLIIGGFAYWFWPAAGFAVASLLFGWLLIAFGIVQLCVSAGRNRPRGWGWWLAGGVIDIFIGFMMVSNLFLAEAVVPYFLALIFAYGGIMAIARAFTGKHYKGWWLYLVNGILLIAVAIFFALGGYMQELNMVSFLTALAFVYWGFIVCSMAYDIKPGKDTAE